MRGVVTREMLEAFVAANPPPKASTADVRRKAEHSYAARSEFNLSAWISERLPDAKERSWSEGRKWILPTCPFNPEHDRGEACIVQFHSGAVSAKCQHDSCVWTWADLRKRLEPEYAERQERYEQRQADRRVSDREPPPEVVYERAGYDEEIARAEAREDAEIDRAAARDADDSAPSTPAPPPWRRAPDLVTDILDRANDPWISLSLAGDELARVRAGGTAVLIGGSGSGKSSLTACLLLDHAKNVGPAIALSIELPAEELGARIVGIRCDASWEDSLRGLVPRPEMERALGLPRLFVLDRRRATLKNLEACIDAARAEFPGEPILCAIDYAQLLESKEREARLRVADAFAQIDDISREKRVVSIALSQMSRASASKARQGDALGAESADLGAETAAIERFATVTMAIGLITEREDGSSSAELSIGKARMGKGDRVIPMDRYGRTGLWRVAGEAKTAAEVREKRSAEKDQKEDTTLEAALLGIAFKSAEPMSQNDLKNQVKGNKSRKGPAIARLLARGDLVEVMKKKRGAKAKDGWMVMHPDRAKDAGIAVVSDITQQELPNA